MAESLGNPFEGTPVIFRYTRKQAIEDGVLVDLTPWARETGFVIPVACTSAVWHGYLEPPPGTREMGQSERGRAHDLLCPLCHARHNIHYVRCWIMRISVPQPLISGGFSCAGGSHNHRPSRNRIRDFEAVRRAGDKRGALSVAKARFLLSKSASR